MSLLSERRSWSGARPFDEGSSTTSAQQPKPMNLQIPDAARQIPPQGCKPMTQTHDFQRGATSLLGVSIGRQQTRMNAVDTPAAEKSAALDENNHYGFFDGSADEREQLADMQEDERKASLQLSPQQAAATTRQLRIASPTSPEHGRKLTRMRATSLFSAHLPSLPSLPDLSVKQFLDNFHAPSLSDTLSKLNPMSSSKDSQSPEKRPSRSNTLFGYPRPWSVGVRKDASSSPTRKPDSTPLDGSRTPASRPALFQPRPTESMSRQQTMSSQEVRGLDLATTVPEMEVDSSGSSTPTSESPGQGAEENEDADAAESATTFEELQSSPRPQLRRRASDGTILSRTSTTYSFEANPAEFEKIDSMVNSRFKAMKDSWQDSSFRLNNVSVVNTRRRISLLPDFLKLTDESSGGGSSSSFGARALSSVFSDGGQDSRTGSQTPPGGISGHAKISRHHMLDAALEQLTGDVLIMGGYRGSVLRSAEYPYRQVWAPIKVGLNVRKVNLELGLDPEDEETEHERIFSSGILSHVGPIDISRRLLKRFRNCDNVRSGKLRLHDYGYDWRLSPELLGRRLIKYLERLRCNQPGVPAEQRGATVIAHSLGGLITRWAVNQRPELFAGVLFAGTPQHCVNILGPIRNGDDVLLSSKVLTAQVNFTLRTSFALLPESGRCFIDKDTKEEYPVDFFDVNSWEENRFSPCLGPPLPALLDKRADRKNSLLSQLRDSVPSLGTRSTSNLTNEYNPASSTASAASNSGSNIGASGSFYTTGSPVRAAQDAVERKAEALSSPPQNAVNPSMSQPPMGGPATAVTIPRDRARAYLERTLADTKRFKQALVHSEAREAGNAYPPLSVLYAASTPTVYGARVTGRDGIRRADAYDNLAFAAGDGVVLARASMLPSGYRVCDGGRVRTDRGHVGLLGDLDSVGRCLVALGEARRRGVGMGALSKEGEEEKR